MTTNIKIDTEKYLKIFNDEDLNEDKETEESGNDGDIEQDEELGVEIIPGTSGGEDEETLQ